VRRLVIGVSRNAREFNRISCDSRPRARQQTIRRPAASALRRWHPDRRNHREFATDNGLDAVSGDLVGKFQRPNMLSVSSAPAQAAGPLRKLAELGDLDRSLDSE